MRGSYLTGCDGGTSNVRKKLGIKLEGRGGIQEVCQVIFGSKDLYDKIPIGKGRHYNFAHPDSSAIIAQGCRTEFTLHTSLPPETDFEPIIRDLVDFPARSKFAMWSSGASTCWLPSVIVMVAYSLPAMPST